MAQRSMSQVSSSPSTLVGVPSPPPPYINAAHKDGGSEDRTGRDLQESFGALLVEQTNVQRLFSTVAARLTNERRIGPGHELCVEWEAMREVRLRMTWTMTEADEPTEASETPSLLTAKCGTMCNLPAK